jgi:hypothetical protein
MRFLDIDLDFFLNKNAYHTSHEHGRLDSEYRPWSPYRVRRFLEGRCGLSTTSPVPGKIVEHHDEVLGIWRALITSGRLKTPFEVVHIDAHPDLWVGGNMYLTPGCLHVEPEQEMAILKTKQIHPGNYLTFALAYGWISSLTWIPLVKYGENVPVWDADARAIMQFYEQEMPENTPIPENELCIPFRVILWDRFKTSHTFDYISLSKSPAFTPRESDLLVQVIRNYMILPLKRPGLALPTNTLTP